ncbi:MAG: M20/M25/M40 family metallo-hydrolase [Longimicrobiales bacterium]|nr:M20/M25/M40 family metallo-hydrolase [Longimicrobiales bacterium]
MPRFLRPLALLYALVIAPVPLDAQSTAFDEEVRRLAQHPAVQRAMALVEEADARTMADLVELTQIPAPPFTETARGARFREMLLELGLDSVWVDEVGNVIGLRKGAGTGKTVAIAGHLDTVFPEGTDVTVRVRGDTLFAPGISDDTRGVVTVLAVARAMRDANVRTDGDILFIGNVGEEGEGDLRGMKGLFGEGGPRIDSFISIDGSGHVGVTHQGLGSHRYNVVFRGPGGHSWGAFGLANPAHALGRAIRNFDEVADSLTASGPRTSYNVGVLEGGTSVNSIPFEVSMDVDMRSESPASLERIDAALHDAVARAVAEENADRRRGEEVTGELVLIGDRPSGEVAEEESIVQRAVAVSRMLGIEPRLGRGSTDSNIPISMGIPAITIGGGGVGGEAHSLHEYFINRDGPLGIQRALLILLAQAGLAVAS